MTPNDDSWVIVPCCGNSSRYPNDAPKWMLPARDGRPMIALALSKLEVMPEQIVVAVRRDHEEAFGATKGIRSALGEEVTVVILEQPTRSQAETVLRTLEVAGRAGGFLVKDSDNQFALTGITEPVNYICVDSLNNHDAINPRNKSYVQVDHRGIVNNIREKEVISDLFSVGGYYFSNAEQFITYFDRLREGSASWSGELYISDVIASMILDDIPFRTRSVEHYRDWGTIREWKDELQSTKVLLVSLDGVVFTRGSQHFRPTFAEVSAIESSAQLLRQASAEGHAILYLSIRDKELAELTYHQLAEANLPDGNVVFGCPVAPWLLVTAPDSTLPFSTSDAVEVSPDDPHLFGKVL